MKKKRQNLELWMGELRDKVRKDGTISNKDIMLFFTKRIWDRMIFQRYMSCFMKAISTSISMKMHPMRTWKF